MATGDNHANQILDFKYGDNAHADMPATVYLTLYYEAPDDSGGGTEADYAGFARVAITNDDTSFPPAADREKELAIDVDFAVPASNTDPIVAWAIHGHATNDDILDWSLFATPLAGVAGRAVSIEGGSLVLTIPATVG